MAGLEIALAVAGLTTSAIPLVMLRYAHRKRFRTRADRIPKLEHFADTSYSLLETLMPVMDSLTALERDPEFYIILSELEKASAVFVKTRKRLLRCAPIARAVKDWERRMEQENAMAGRQWEGEWEDEDGGAAASWEDVGDYLNAEKSGLRDHEDPKTEWRKGRKERKRRTAERSKAPYGKASGTSESERLLANEYGYR